MSPLMMSRRSLLLGGVASGLAFAVPANAAPRQPRHRVRIERFGHVRYDDYAWLKPANWAEVRRDPSRLDPAIHSVLDSENRYAAAMLAPTRSLQDALLREMKTYVAAAGDPPPVSDAGWTYAVRSVNGYARYSRRREEGPEQILLDVATEAAGKAYYAVSTFSPPTRSPDHSLFAWAADDTGSEYDRLTMRDAVSGETLWSDIAQCSGSFAFSPDSRFLFWIWRNDVGRPTKVFRRPARGGEDVLVYEEKDPALFLHLSLSASGRMLRIHAFNGDMTELRLVFEDGSAPPALVEPRCAGLHYDVQDWGDGLVVLTNADGAEDYKIMRTSRDGLARAHWQEWVPHRKGCFIAEIKPFRDFLVRLQWQNANPHLVITDRAGAERDIAFEDEAYALRLQPDQAFDGAVLRYCFETPRRPPRWVAYDMARGVRQEADDAIPGVDPQRYVVRRLEAPAPDGATIPVTILMRRDLAVNGKAPLYLHGYGSYGDNVLAEYSAPALALVDRGWIYALAHVRGGGEKGTGWWRSVLKTGKKTTFTDFIAAAEALIASGYTAKGRIVAHGLSAGGLLMGAVYNMRPDLWAGVVMQVPFVDLLGTMEDASHPLWYTALPFWGDPRIKSEWEYMASYSPYSNIRPQAYPPLLATGSISDGRVAFWEPLKFALKARDCGRVKTPKIVEINMAGGHMGAAGPDAHLQQEAKFFAFAIWSVEHRWR